MIITNFHPSKKMGQNFLINKNIAQRITNLIEYQNHDCVVEIGPGKGALTEFLVDKEIPVIAIELDKRLAEYIKTRHKTIQIINDDVLKIDLNKLLQNYKKPILLSNLPYSISSPILFKYLTLERRYPFVCMMQKEFVDRLMASPKSKTYGALSVICQTYLDIEKKLQVEKTNFIPQPEIDSVVILINRKAISVNQKFINFIRVCFQAKRKTLFNNLKASFNKLTIQNVIAQLKLKDTVRAEELPHEIFMKLFNLLNYETKSI
jgi:16S rRNA (adenine1518-N6/adenine1519-N6)-dimethyltransferase